MKNVTMEEIVAFFGSQKAMAEKLGVSEAAVSYFINQDGFPAFRAIQIEIMTDGKFKAADLIETNRFFDQIEKGEV